MRNHYWTLNSYQSLDKEPGRILPGQSGHGGLNLIGTFLYLRQLYREKDGQTDRALFCTDIQSNISIFVTKLLEFVTTMVIIAQHQVEGLHCMKLMAISLQTEQSDFIN